jgi:hypothetical protein
MTNGHCRNIKAVITGLQMPRFQIIVYFLYGSFSAAIQ